MRAVLYARVSSAQQRDRHTIASQLRELPAYIARQGWTLERPVGTYVDDGRSAAAGKIESREAFRRLLRDVAAGVCDVVVVVDLDRITRTDDPAERGLILAAFRAAGVQLVALAGGRMDLGTPEGELVATVQMIVAAADNRKRAAAFRRGVDEAIRQGRKPRGATPFGLRYDSTARAWSIDEERAAIVREVYGRLVVGETAVAIGRDLEARGVGSPRGGRWVTALWRLVARPTYRGVLLVDQARGLEVAVPRIVEDSVWYAAQAQLAANGLRGLRRTRHPYLIEGLAACGVCGADVWTHAEARSSGGRRYYACSRRLRPVGHAARCSLPFVRVERLDAAVWLELVAAVSRDDLLGVVGAREAESATERPMWEADLAQAERRREQLEAAEVGILERYRRGLISEAAMDRHLRGLGRERAQLRDQAEHARQAASARSTPDPAAAVAELRRRILAPSPEERRALARTLIAPGGVVLAADGSASLSLRIPPNLTEIARPCDRSSFSPEDPDRSQGAIRLSLRAVTRPTR